jgi:tripartite-type tricarboxylate transporter receptor subunit TctC
MLLEAEAIGVLGISMRFIRILAHVLIAGSALAGMTMALQAQTSQPSWPQRTVRMIVPNPPGTATDVTARLYADRLSLRWGKPVVVENRPGPDALVAVNAFVGGRDDHTLLFSFGAPVTMNTVLHAKLPYDPERDLVPIVAAADSFIAFAVTAALEVSSLQELAKRAKEEPGRLTWASTPGMPQFGFVGFAKSAGIDMLQVAYRDFTPALQDVSEGRINVVSTGLLGLTPLGQGGKVRILAVTNRRRAPSAPLVPTVEEAGFPDAIAEGFQGFFGWRDMSSELRERIAADVRAVAPELPADRLAALGQVVRVGSTADFVAMLDDQRNRVAAIAKALDLKPLP